MSCYIFYSCYLGDSTWNTHIATRVKCPIDLSAALRRSDETAKRAGQITHRGSDKGTRISDQWPGHMRVAYPYQWPLTHSLCALTICAHRPDYVSLSLTFLTFSHLTSERIILYAVENNQPKKTPTWLETSPKTANPPVPFFPRQPVSKPAQFGVKPAHLATLVSNGESAMQALR